MSTSANAHPPASGILPVVGLLALLAVPFLSACSSARASSPRDADRSDVGLILTREDIARSGAHTALEAVERSRSHLTIAHTRQGTPVRITHRGIDSFVLNAEVLLVVDGSRTAEPVQMMRIIPASSIDYIQILSGREAVLVYGSESSNGVILIHTSAGR